MLVTWLLCCTTLHYTALYTALYTTLHYTTLSHCLILTDICETAPGPFPTGTGIICTATICSAVHCNTYSAMPYRQCTALQWTSGTALHYTAVHYIVLHYCAFHRTALQNAIEDWHINCFSTPVVYWLSSMHCQYILSLCLKVSIKLLEMWFWNHFRIVITGWSLQHCTALARYVTGVFWSLSYFVGTETSFYTVKLTVPSLDKNYLNKNGKILMNLRLWNQDKNKFSIYLNFLGS